MKSKYQILLDQYNNRNKTSAPATQISSKNAFSMIFGAIFIFIYGNMLLHGNLQGFIISYLFIGLITAVAAWAQLKYFNKVNPIYIKRMWKNYSFLKVGVAWLPAIFIDKVNRWVYA